MVPPKAQVLGVVLQPRVLITLWPSTALDATCRYPAASFPLDEQSLAAAAVVAAAAMHADGLLITKRERENIAGNIGSMKCVGAEGSASDSR